MSIFLIVSVIIFVVGLILLFLMSRQQKSFGSLSNKIISLDKGENPGITLYSQTIPLIGRPDYLIKIDEEIVPVEIKSGKTPGAPYESHTMQLMAYCLLVEENFGKKPPGGIIRYPEKEFKIAYTDEAKEALIMLVKEILKCKTSNKEFSCPHPYHQLLFLNK